MPAKIIIDPDSGSASIALGKAVQAGRKLKFSLQDLRTQQYLSEKGWWPTRKTLVEVTSADGFLRLSLPPDMAAMIASGTPLLLEEIFVNYRESLVWPKAAEAEPIMTKIPVEDNLSEALDTAPRQPARLEAESLPVVSGASAHVSPGIVVGQGFPAKWPYLLIGLLIGAGVAGSAVFGLSPSAGPAPAARVDKAIPSLSVADQSNPAGKVVADDGDRIVELTLLKTADDIAKAHIAELEATVEGLRGELSLRDASLAEAQRSPALPSSESPDDNAALKAEITRLTEENAQVTLRAAQATQSIARWTEERNVHVRKIEDLEKQVALLKLGEERTVQVDTGEPQAERGSGSERKPSGWGSIASSASGIVYVIGGETEQAAQSAAMAGCQKANGGNPCQWRENFQNQCVAIARVYPGRKSDQWIMEFATNMEDAAAAVLDSCTTELERDCTLTAKVCSGT
jgi:hypothetical protein